MQRGMNLQELAVEVQRQSVAKKDFQAPASMCRFDVGHQDDGALLSLILDDHGRFDLKPTAVQQVREFTGIPAKYFELMHRDAPQLLDDNVNYWLRKSSRARMVRTMGEDCRAFLSPSYRPLDNWDLAQVVLPLVSEMGLEVVSSNVSDDYLHLHVVSERIRGEVKRGDIVQSGFEISNSEVGRGRLRISELDWRLVCLNGMIGQDLLAQSHVTRPNAAIEEVGVYMRDETRALNDAAFFEGVKDVLAHIMNPERFEARIAKYKDAAEQTIVSPPIKAIEVIAEKLQLGVGEKENVLKHLIEGGDLSKWGYANAVTRLAHDADYDRAVELERAGSEIIELDPRAWERAAEKVKLAA